MGIEISEFEFEDSNWSPTVRRDGMQHTQLDLERVSYFDIFNNNKKLIFVQDEGIQERLYDGPPIFDEYDDEQTEQCYEEFDAIHSEKAKSMLDTCHISELIRIGYTSDSSIHDASNQTFLATIREPINITLSNSWEKDGSSGTVDLCHFAFYVFAGQSGLIRWKRKNENIPAQPSSASQLIPQHNYKLDVHAMIARHPGEFECREFRDYSALLIDERKERKAEVITDALYPHCSSMFCAQCHVPSHTEFTCKEYDANKLIKIQG